jgi:hypothetical protein
MGALAIKIGPTVVTLTAVKSSTLPPLLRVNGTLVDLPGPGDTLVLGERELGTTAVVGRVLGGGDASNPKALAVVSFEFLSGPSFGVSVVYSEGMGRQFLETSMSPGPVLKGATAGLAGSYDGDMSNDFAGPDGVVHTSVVRSWVVQGGVAKGLADQCAGRGWVTYLGTCAHNSTRPPPFSLLPPSFCKADPAPCPLSGAGLYMPRTSRRRSATRGEFSHPRWCQYPWLDQCCSPRGHGPRTCPTFTPGTQWTTPTRTLTTHPCTPPPASLRLSCSRQR